MSVLVSERCWTCLGSSIFQHYALIYASNICSTSMLVFTNKIFYFIKVFIEKFSNFNQKKLFFLISRLISNTFVIDSAGISPATRLREQRARGMQRRMNIAPQHVNFDIKFDSPEKESDFTDVDDTSFYSSNNLASSPRPCPISPCRDDVSLLSPGTSPSVFIIDNVQLPRPNSFDSSSMDSGYSGLQQDSNNRLSQTSTALSSTSSSLVFQFIEPRRPEMSSSSSPSILTTPSKYSSSSIRANSAASAKMGFTVFHSLSSGSGSESIDDDYLELMDMESLDEDAQMPTDISSLICKDIIKSSTKTPENKRSSDSYARKCLNMDGGQGVKTSLFGSPSTPKTSTTISSLITTPERQCLQKISENVAPFSHRNNTTGTFKRPEPPMESPIKSKRYKCENDPPASAEIMKFTHPQFPQKRPVLRKSVSMNDAVIMNALSRSSSESNLIGDFSRPYCLPLVEGRHSDLKSISADTMRKLLSGEFDESVAAYKTVDCRYPYEFDGGHIRGALNLYTHEQILEELVTKKTETPPMTDGQKRNILVFHCEFSSERGPKL